MFNRFKEKLSGFKEALSAKVAEKVSAKGSKGAAQPEEIEAEDRSALEAPDAGRKGSKAKEPKMGASSGSAKGEPLAKPSDNGEAKNKKGRFSFLQKAKTLVFEQEIILEEKDLEEPMWALEMA